MHISAIFIKLNFKIMSHGGGSKIGDLGLLIFFLIILFVLWYWLGGKNHKEAKTGPYINPLVNQIPTNNTPKNTNSNSFDSEDL